MPYAKMYRVVILLYLGLILGCFCEPDCSRPPPFVRPHSCCHEPKPNDVHIKCAQVVGFPLHDQNKATGQRHPPDIQTAACFADCVLNQSNYLLNGNLDMDTITTDVQTNSDPEFAAVIIPAFQKCEPIAKLKLEAVKNMPLATTALNGCNPYAGLLFSCVFMEYFVNCPENKWQGGAECDALRDHIKSCPIPPRVPS